MMREIHRAKTLNSGNPRIQFILHYGICTHRRSHHLQALPSSTTMPHSTWHQASNQALLQPKDIRVMGHCGKHMIAAKEVMVDFKCSPLSNSQDMGRHLQLQYKCLQHPLETIQSFGWHLPPLWHEDNFPAHLGARPLASQRTDRSRLGNHGGQMLQGLPVCLDYQRFPIMNTMQIVRAMICQTWARPKATPQSAWSKRNSPWSNLPQGWCSPTSVPSTSARKYGWLGIWRSCIGPLSGDRTVWNCFEMDPCTGRCLLQMV